jgi:hypothetical protein
MALIAGAAVLSPGLCGSPGLRPLESEQSRAAAFFRGVGRLLLLFARQRSLELGYGGRLGLHALPESEAFYRRLQMPDYGADPEKEDLVYFEYGVMRQ